jgi:hypothetical protein
LSLSQSLSGNGEDGRRSAEEAGGSHQLVERWPGGDARLSTKNLAIHKKLWGRSSRPLCRCLLQLLSASCCFSSLLSFWLPWIYSPFSILHGILQR